MHFDRFNVLTSFMIGPLLFVVEKNGAIWKFEGFNNWTQVAYLPVT